MVLNTKHAVIITTFPSSNITDNCYYIPEHFTIKVKKIETRSKISIKGGNLESLRKARKFYDALVAWMHTKSLENLRSKQLAFFPYYSKEL